MKKQITTLIAAAAMAGVTSITHAQTDGAAQMKAWQDYMTPGKVQAGLAKSSGEWKTETTMWMDPSAAPQKSEGTCTNTMIMGGRYQQGMFKGTAMGQPFEGLSTIAYDNAKKVFVMTWIDNMGTGLTTLEGPWDNATKSISFSGMEVNPTTGKDMQVREKLTIIDDNHKLMEMFMVTPAGTLVKNMEVKMTRL